MRTDETQSVHEVGTMKYFQERTMRHNVYSDKERCEQISRFLPVCW